MVHLTSNIIEAFSNNAAYSEKGTEMWEKVCDIQERRTPKSLLTNPHILFGFFLGSTQENPSTYRASGPSSCDARQVARNLQCLWLTLYW